MQPAYNTVMSALGIEKEVRLWSGTWSAARSGFPLSTGYIEYWNKKLNVSAETGRLIIEGLSFFEDVPESVYLFNLCRELMFRRDAPLEWDEISNWPMPSFEVHEYAEFFYIYVLYSALPELRDIYKKREIPEDVFHHTMSDLELWMDKHYFLTGRRGLSEFFWLYIHFTGRIFRLGRLQFEIVRSGERLSVWRCRKDNRLIASGGPDKQSSPPAGEDWETVVGEDHTLLNIHIPSGEPMDHKSCGESMNRAVVFFRRHFPDIPFRSFVCHSWLLDRQLLEYLPEKSNIARFMKELNLYTLPDSESDDIVQNVLGRDCGDPLNFKAETSLQKIVVDHLKKGGTWRIGGGFLLPEDLDWGSGLYDDREN